MSTTSGTGPRAAIFLRIDSSPVVALWLGFGDIDVPINTLDVAGQTYQGLGLLVGIPELSMLLNGVAERVDFTLSGIPQAAIEASEAGAAAVRNKAVNVGVSTMDDDWQLSGDILWLWDGRADVLTASMRAESDGSQTYTIQLSVGTSNTGRARPDFATWTDAQHQRAHPGDTFFAHVPPPEKTKRWPGG